MTGEVATGNLSPSADCPVIVLASGQTLRVRSVKLFEADKVNEVANLKAAAVQKFGGVSTGIGFWGSPGWVLGGVAALGFLEGLLSSAARKEGVELLRRAETGFQEMVAGAQFFDASHLMNSHIPYPQAWSAVGISVRHIDVSELNWLSRKNLLRQHGKSENDIEHFDGTPYLVIRSEKRYVHDGDEFVNIGTGIGTISIRWSHIVAYFPPQLMVS